MGRADGVETIPMHPGCLEPFARNMQEWPSDHRATLCRMLGLTAADTDSPNAGEWTECVTIRLTSDHYVDADGVVWPEWSFAVIPNYAAKEPVYILVAPKPRG